MFKVNKKIEYALMVLKFISTKKAGELTSAREVCDKFHTPFDTTAKVMQSLNNNKILNSVKGIKGGYSLSQNLDSISYVQLVKIIEGKKLKSVCTSDRGVCELRETCNIVGPMESLNNKLLSFLGDLTIEELLETTPYTPA